MLINAEIYDGDIVFIRKQPVVDNGEIAAVIIDDEATLKRVYFDKEHERSGGAIPALCRFQLGRTGIVSICGNEQQ